MAATLNWGILGTGEIASTFARALAGSDTGKLVAIASRSQAGADRFATEHEAPRAHASYDALLADPNVQAVYISTPHPFHAEWSIAAANAKKHVLCEKPLAMNAMEAARVIEAARANGVFLMEAFMYRCHRQTRRIVELIRQRAIGDVRFIHAAFSFCHPPRFDPTSRLLDKKLGGGSILDVGCYCASAARLIAGAAAGRDFVEPDEVKAVAHIGSTGVDEWSAAAVRFPDGIVAQLACGIQVRQESELRIDGSAGSIVCATPWTPGVGNSRSQLFLRSGPDATTTPIVIDEPKNLYAIEADAVADAIERGLHASPTMNWEDSIGNMSLLDAWRASVGLTYEADSFA